MEYRKFVASAAAAATLATGGIVVAAVNPVSSAFGQDDPSEAAPAEGRQRGARLDAVLAGLVEDGTLTQEQADAVEQALRDARPEGRPGRGHRRPAARQTIKVAAEAIGITPEALVEELKAGKSIAEVAEANGVELATVKDALLGAAEARIDQVLEAKRPT